MSSQAHTVDPDAPQVYLQYEDIDQQQESYIVGMWSFLVTEVMFFGALFLLYTVYRTKHQADFYLVHEQLRWQLGAVNTTILLFSSFTMALAVHFAQLKKKGPQLVSLGITLICAFGFLAVKTTEYGEKFEHNLFPNKNFTYGQKHEMKDEGATPFATFNAKNFGGEHEEEGDPQKARLFLSMYFAMTGLHGLHVVIGIGVIGTLMALIKFNHPIITDYIPTEMVGLYWHFVDLVWIFLYPLFYLIPK